MANCLAVLLRQSQTSFDFEIFLVLEKSEKTVAFPMKQEACPLKAVQGREGKKYCGGSDKTRYSMLEA